MAGMGGSPDGLQYMVLIKSADIYLEKKQTYLTHPPLVAEKPLLCSLVLSLCQLACWANLFLLPRKYGFWGGRNAKIIVGEIQLEKSKKCIGKCERNTIENDFCGGLHRHPVSAQLLRQSPVSQFYGKQKLLPRWKAGKDLPRNRNLVQIFK